MRRTWTARTATAARRLGLGMVLTGLACSQVTTTGPGSDNNQQPPGQQPPTKGASGLPNGPMSVGPVPFQPFAAEAYLAKVKDLLVGQAPTDDELRAVKADPNALRGLIDIWMKTPQYQAKMMVFFRNAFQQGQVGLVDFTDQLPLGINGNAMVNTRMLASLQESFARTVLQLVSEGRPFNEVLTTQRFMLNPPLMALYAYMDAVHIDDAGGRIDRTLKMNPKFQITIHSTGPTIPLTDSLDPNSPNFMHWNNTVPIPQGAPPACLVEPRTYVASTGALLDFLFGRLDPIGGVNGCQPAYLGPGQFVDADFDNWRMVNVRLPQQGELPTKFYDLPTLRAANEMVMTIPRVGFFTTPAFFANWQTNSSNVARVTINQTLIVALGSSFDDSNDINPVAETALDQGHASPGSPCYSCHKTLDPMRQYIRQAYTLFYHEQLDPAQANVQGVFAFGGQTSQGTGITDLAAKLAAHDDFATAWTQKVCFWANSAACSEDDPEFIRIAGVFKSSGFQWPVLVREMLASPLTTGAANTKTFDDRGLVVTVARRDSLCTALSTRLNVTDLCGLSGGPGLAKSKELSTGVPSDGYSRGSVAPLLANDPSLFFRDSTENLCRSLADAVVDIPAGRYTSRQPDAAIADFVQNLMSLGKADARSPAVQQVLTDHYASALKAGLKPTDALKSTFVLACESPTSVARGL